MKKKPKDERGATGRYSVDARLRRGKGNDSCSVSVASSTSVSSSFVDAFARFDVKSKKFMKKNLSPVSALKIVGNVMDTVHRKVGQKLKTFFPDGKITEEILAEALADDLFGEGFFPREEQEDLIVDIVGPKVKIHPETMLIM